MLANCPFHILAQDHTELVCGMNLRLLNGLLDGLAPTGLTARLDPAPPHCCVRLESAVPDQPPSEANARCGTHARLLPTSSSARR
jgi:predicted ArsR family transcriptional regulator